MGFAQDMEICLVPLRLYYDYDPRTGALENQIDGRLDLARRLLILGEVNPTLSLVYLLGHELGHLVWRLWIRQDDTADTPALREFCRIAGINPAEWPENGPWERRLRELGADLISQALWGAQPRECFPALTWQQRMAMRTWIMGLWPAGALATIEIVDAPAPVVHIHSDGALLLDGMGVPLPPDLRPRLFEGRFLMPVRTIMEQVVDPLVQPHGLRAGIDWDGAKAIPWVRR